MIRLFFYISFIAALFCFGSCDKPSERLRNNGNIEDRIIDSANLLSTEQEENIFKLVQELKKSVGSEIAIVTLKTLNGKNLNQYSIQKAETLSLGRELYNDGVLITVAVQERMTRIEVGKGLEKIIKDEIASQIIRDRMRPKFKEKKFYEGIHDAVNAMKDLIEQNKTLIGKKP